MNSETMENLFTFALNTNTSFITNSFNEHKHLVLIFQHLYTSKLIHEWTHFLEWPYP
jgi:hypothetical protein